MTYEDRLHVMIEKGTVSAEQARQFAEELEKLSMPSAAGPNHRPVSMAKMGAGILALLALGIAVISLAASGSNATAAPQQVAEMLNMQGATGDAGAATGLLGWFLILSLPAACIMFFIASLYNRLVDADEDTRKTAAYISNQLQRKQALIPALENIATTALRYEETLQHSTAEARGPARDFAGAVQSAQQDGAAPLSGALNAVAEAYPDVKALAALHYVQQELSRVEDGLLIARHVHNDALAELNRTARGAFGSVAARMYGFRPQPRHTV